jgi:PTS system beta-glucosides-specific IIC component
MVDEAAVRKIVEGAGGQENIRTLGHCMTRLRFRLKDFDKADDAAIEKIKDVKGVRRTAGEYHVILGTGIVDEYYDAIMSRYRFENEDYTGVRAEEDFDSGSGKNPAASAITNALNILAGSIGPWLGCIMGSLMISAILSLLSSLGLVGAEDATYQFFSLVSAACLYTLPIFIGFSAAEKLETNKYMGALLGAIMIYPALMSAVSEGTVSVFGVQIQNFSYTSTIIPVILGVWLLKYVERFAKRICPNVIAIFGVTLIELVICVPLIYLVVGPIGSLITSGIAGLVMLIYQYAGIFAPAAAAAIMPLAVMAGVHLGLFPIATLMISEVGYDPIIHPALMAYNMSIAGASFAYGLRTKDPDKRSLGLSSGLSGILGISEAGLFGVVLPNRRILATCEIGIIISGIITGLVGYKVYVPLSQSVFAIPAAAHGDFNIFACIISLASGVVASFLVTYFFGCPKEGETEETAPVTVPDTAIVAPADGELVAASALPDPVFAEETLGESVALKCAGDKAVLCAPANGTLSALFPTGHAFGVTMADGTELLVHCGIDTVAAKGDGFRLLGKKQGDTVKAGEPIVEMDVKKLSSRYDTSVILVVMDSHGDEPKLRREGSVCRGEILGEA